MIYCDLLDSVYTTALSPRALPQHKGRVYPYEEDSLQSGRLNILRTCRVIYAEAVHHLYSKQQFRFYLPRPFLLRLDHRANADSIQNIQIEANWNRPNDLKTFMRDFVARIPRNYCRIILSHEAGDEMCRILVEAAANLIDVKSVIIDFRRGLTMGLRGFLAIIERFLGPAKLRQVEVVGWTQLRFELRAAGIVSQH